MVNQEDLAEQQFVQYQFFEIPDQGELHTLNVPETEEQRREVTSRGLNSDYTIQVRLFSCVHGTWDETEKQPASLIVFDYAIKFTDGSRVFSSVRTSFVFSQWKNPSAPEGPVVRGYGPEVLAYAPFQEYTRFQETTGEKKTHKGFQPTVGTPSGLPVQASLGVDVSDDASWTQQYFDEGFARIKHDEKANLDSGVEWYMKHNTRQNHGISPHFRVAVLLKRDDDKPYFGHFLVKARGGFRFAVSEAVRNLVMTPDDPVIFNPNLKPLWQERQSFDEKSTGIDPKNLGKLATDDQLKGLSHVWGLSPMKKPDDSGNDPLGQN